jgi:hypothetical protein
VIRRRRERGRRELQGARQVQLVLTRPGRPVEDPRDGGPLLQHPGHRPRTPGRKPKHHAREFPTVEDQRATVALHHLTMIQSHPNPVRVELRRVCHRVSTPPHQGWGSRPRAGAATPALGRLLKGECAPLISLACSAQNQVPSQVRAAHTCLVPASERSAATHGTAAIPPSTRPAPVAPKLRASVLDLRC